MGEKGKGEGQKRTERRAKNGFHGELIRTVQRESFKKVGTP